MTFPADDSAGDGTGPESVWPFKLDFWQAAPSRAAAARGRIRRILWITYFFAFPPGKNQADSLLLNPLVVSIRCSVAGPFRSKVPLWSAEMAQRFQPGA